MPAPWPIAPPVTMATLPSQTSPCSDLQLHDRVGGEADGRGRGRRRSRRAACRGRRRSQSEPDLSKRCSTTGAATSATIPPYTTKTWPVIRVGGRRGEVGDQRRDVLGRVGVDLLAGRVLAEDLGGHRGAGARADRVGADADPAQRRARSRRVSAAMPALAARVVGLSGRAAEERLGRGVDDPAVDRGVGLLRPAPASTTRRCARAGSGRAGARG